MITIEKRFVKTRNRNGIYVYFVDLFCFCRSSSRFKTAVLVAQTVEGCQEMLLLMYQKIVRRKC